MPYVPPLEQENAPKEAKPLLAAIEKNFGQSLNLFSTLAHQPDVLEGVTKINDGIHNDLPEKLRELAYLKSSRLNKCDYCSHYHTQAAKKAGVSDAQLEALDNFTEGGAFDEQETAVLAFATELTQTGDVEPRTAENVMTFLDDAQLVTLSATVALANFTNRVNHGLGIELP